MGESFQEFRPLDEQTRSAGGQRKPRRLRPIVAWATVLLVTSVVIYCLSLAGAHASPPNDGGSPVPAIATDMPASIPATATPAVKPTAVATALPTPPPAPANPVSPQDGSADPGSANSGPPDAGGGAPGEDCDNESDNPDDWCDGYDG